MEQKRNEKKITTDRCTGFKRIPEWKQNKKSANIRTISSQHDKYTRKETNSMYMCSFDSILCAEK